MTIEDDVNRQAALLDASFDAAQPRLMAKLRAAGVSDAEMPGQLAEAHRVYWRERCLLLARYQVLRTHGPRH